MKSIRIDRSKRLVEDAGAGHNRWHLDILPILEAAPGEEILPETRDAAGGQVKLNMPVRADGNQESEDLTLTARNALLEMSVLLGERGFTREQAYAICSVAVDLRISNAVDLPNVTVSALLPEAFFAD